MATFTCRRDLMATRHWVCVFAFVLALVTHPVAPRAQQTPEATTAIAVRTAIADGVSLQYLTAGSGPAIVLLHGYAETSRMWRPPDGPRNVVPRRRVPCDAVAESASFRTLPGSNGATPKTGGRAHRTDGRGSRASIDPREFAVLPRHLSQRSPRYVYAYLWVRTSPFCAFLPSG